MVSEVFSIADDEAVFFDGPKPVRREHLEPATAYDGFRTLPRPPGQRLATVTAVNDLHFGEVNCGHLEGLDLGPVLHAEPGAEPYPVLMNRAAVAEMAALAPDAVVIKGDVTTVGDPQEYAAFEACYRPILGDRLAITRGNHDNPARGPAFDCPTEHAVTLPGVVLAVIDTSRPGVGGGRLGAEQMDWLDELAGRADRPVLVFGHHPVPDPADHWLGPDRALDQASTDALVEVVARRPTIRGYFAGHTHRNKTHHLDATGPFPYTEVASVKDFPGSWAEYRIFEGGILQVHRRIGSDPAAVAWSEKCRALFGGLYPRYALGDLAERCFELPLRD